MAGRPPCRTVRPVITLTQGRGARQAGDLVPGDHDWMPCAWLGPGGPRLAGRRASGSSGARLRCSRQALLAEASELADPIHPTSGSALTSSPGRTGQEVDQVVVLAFTVLSWWLMHLTGDGGEA